MEEVREWEEVGAWLGVPESKRNEIKQQSCTVREKRCALGEYWVNHAPQTSWERLAWALYLKKEERAAEVAYQYLPKGMSLS